MEFIKTFIIVSCIFAALVSLGNSCAKDATDFRIIMGRVFCALYLLLAYMGASGGF